MRIAIVLKFFCICAVGGVAFVAGCGRNYAPRIVGELTIAPACEPAAAKTPEDIEKTAAELGVPVEWIPPADKEHSWFAIILHHSATEMGNASYFNKAHSDRLDDFGERWLGIGYDFVIGNGTMSGDGEVETTFRWKEQLVGAHCKTGDNWANTYGVGIVLVGNFDKSQPSEKQMESLTKLVRYLQKRYDIPTSDIYGHGGTPGGHATACPGSNFPMEGFKQRLSEPVVASHNIASQDLSN